MTTLMPGKLDEIPHGLRSAQSESLTRSLDALRDGRPVVVIGGSGAFVMLLGAAANPHGTAALVRHGSGLIYVTMPQERLSALQIPPMPTDSGSLCPGMHVAVDAATGVTTGISATDRAHTIRQLSTASSTPEMFNRPGHVLPIRADHIPAGSPHDQDIAAMLAWLTGAQIPVAAYCDLVSHDHPTEIAAPAEATTLAAALSYPAVHRRDIVAARYRTRDTTAE